MLTLFSILALSFGIVAEAVPARIVNGHDAPNHKYPYQVSLQGFEIGHFCSGSILNEHWILTAAHCVDEPYPKNYTISAGSNFLDVLTDAYMPQFSVIHEQFVSFEFYDIALIRVAGKIVFNDFVKPIALANEEQNDRLTALMAGWGFLSADGPTPNALQEIELHLISNEQCKESRKFTDSSHICTYTKIGEGICFGDSGGPLVVEGVQVGIASNVMPCAIGYADVFTRVSHYIDWINSTIQRF